MTGTALTEAVRASIAKMDTLSELQKTKGEAKARDAAQKREELEKLTAEIRADHESFETAAIGAVRASINAAAAIGAKLARIKKLAGHGNYLKALESIGINVRTAQGYVKAHEALSLPNANLDSYLTLSDLLRGLAKPATPKQLEHATRRKAETAKRKEAAVKETVAKMEAKIEERAEKRAAEIIRSVKEGGDPGPGLTSAIAAREPAKPEPKQSITTTKPQGKAATDVQTVAMKARDMLANASASFRDRMETIKLIAAMPIPKEPTSKHVDMVLTVQGACAKLLGEIKAKMGAVA